MREYKEAFLTVLCQVVECFLHLNSTARQLLLLHRVLRQELRWIQHCWMVILEVVLAHFRQAETTTNRSAEDFHYHPKMAKQSTVRLHYLKMIQEVLTEQNFVKRALMKLLVKEVRILGMGP